MSGETQPCNNVRCNEPATMNVSTRRGENGNYCTPHGRELAALMVAPIVGVVRLAAPAVSPEEKP